MASVHSIRLTYAELAAPRSLDQPCAAAVVVEASGSTPARAGARAVFEGSRLVCGTVGGGALEAACQHAAHVSCSGGVTTLASFSLEGELTGGETPPCGGSLRVLVYPVSADDRAAFARAAEALATRDTGILVTRVGAGPHHAVTVDWQARAGAGTAEAPRTTGTLQHQETAQWVESSGTGIAGSFVEPVRPEPRLLIVGGGHVGQAVAAQAALVGFDITVIDDRPEFVRPELFPPEVQTLCTPMADGVARFPHVEDTYVVIVTRNHRHDADALAACARGSCAYVGMMGSQRKVAAFRADFLERKLATTAEFDEVFAPIGLPIGSATVTEIAVSVVAELVAVRRLGRAAARRRRAGLR